MTHLMDKGKAVDVVYLNFCKVFNTVSHSLFLQKQADLSLDGCSTVHWLKKIAILLRHKGYCERS